jgi:NAD-dependent dihydropyrimidine dehydrogenase PreA subunit
MPTEVNEEKCIGCGACVSVCPANPNVYEMQDKGGNKKSVVKNRDACIECGACVTACPVEAIKLVQK